jgi:hypothetical protein
MERRTELTKVLRYLHNGIYSNEEELADSVRAQVMAFLKGMLMRTRNETLTEDTEAETMEVSQNDEPLVLTGAKDNFKDELKDVCFQGVSKIKKNT